MTDPKSQSGYKRADKTGVAYATVIDIEPTQASDNHNDGTAAKRGWSLRIRLIGVLMLLIIITGTLAAMLYPLWRDRADALVSQTGLPLSLPAVPDNGFYRTVGDVITFFEGASPRRNSGRPCQSRCGS